MKGEVEHEENEKKNCTFFRSFALCECTAATKDSVCCAISPFSFAGRSSGETGVSRMSRRTSRKAGVAAVSAS